MGIRHWFRDRVAGEPGDDMPPGKALFSSLFNEAERVRSLGEYDSRSYPRELADLLRRRQQVAQELLSIEITSPQARVEAIPKLKELLRVYPHPLVYETLIHAYVDTERYDEAKGVAFAARERRMECSRSEFPEIRAETDRLSVWELDDIDRIREEREKRSTERVAERGPA
jgi:hypothetical protein